MQWPLVVLVARVRVTVAREQEANDAYAADRR